MPYTHLGDETAKAMAKSWDDLKQMIAAMKKDKKADKKKIADLEKELDLKGQNVNKKIMADIAIAKKSAFDHAAKVDKWLGDAQQAIKAAQAARQKMEQSHSMNDMETAGYAVGFITELHRMADLDGKECGDSWFAYRGGIVDKVDKKYVDPYKVIRNEMIGAEKAVKAKRAQILALVTEAVNIRDSAKRSLLGGLKDLEDHQADAEKLATDLAEQAKIVDNGTNLVAGKLGSVKGNLVQPVITPELFTVSEGMLKESTAQLNLAKSTATVMSKNYTTTVKTFSGDELKDPKIKVSVEKAKGIVDTSVAKVKKASLELAEMSSTVSAMFKKVKSAPAPKKTAKVGK